MYKILIVDDESLARIGLQTMLVSLYGEQIEITGAAQDGKEAAEMMAQVMPDVVISDIKMPVMTGLELAKLVEETYEEKPLFIFLTSYEDFHYAREALQYRAFDYLIKMEFNRELLKKVLDRAFEECEQKKRLRMLCNPESIPEMSNVFISRFYYSLLNGRYASEEQILEAAATCEQEICAQRYVTMAMRICYGDSARAERRDSYNLYLSILNSVKMVLQMYYPSYVVAYNHETLGCILMFAEKEGDGERLEQAGREAVLLCRQYFNVRLQIGIGREVFSLCDITGSFQSAQLTLEHAREENRDVLSYHACLGTLESRHNQQEVDMAKTERRLVEALEHCDAEAFEHILDEMYELLKMQRMETAIGHISSLIHLVMNCLEGGERVLTEAFSSQNMNYRFLYSIRQQEDLLHYLQTVRNCISEKLKSLSNNPKYRLVQEAKTYIQEHIYERVSLAEVAGAIGISQNYLSSLFRLYNGSNFSEYVAESKIQLAKEMLAKGNMKIYQISEKLGFDNQQYFSKVYKKYTGYSPSEKIISS
ncbi:MAG: response regulator [bacterium]|nr:response regulator [bacterium]